MTDTIIKKQVSFESWEKKKLLPVRFLVNFLWCLWDQLHWQIDLPLCIPARVQFRQSHGQDCLRLIIWSDYQSDKNFLALLFSLEYFSLPCNLHWSNNPFDCLIQIFTDNCQQTWAFLCKPDQTQLIWYLHSDFPSWQSNSYTNSYWRYSC